MVGVIAMLMKRLQAYVAKQLGHPAGGAGRLLLRVLNRGNATMNQLALTMLAVQPQQHILEIGFGGGDLMQRLRQTERSLHITGIDPAPASLAVGQNRFKSAIASGQLSLYAAAAEAIPLPDQTVDAIVTVNTVYFWSAVETVLAECHRCLKPDGKLAIAYAAKAFLEAQGLTQYGFRAYDVAELEAALRTAGFREIQTRSDESASNGKFFCTCGIAALATNHNECSSQLPG